MSLRDLPATVADLAGLGPDHPFHPQLGQDLRVGFADGLRPDGRPLEAQQDRRGQDARLQIASDAHDHAVELGQGQLT